MKKELFKKFATRDFNEYYVAEINNELYYGVSTLFNYKAQAYGITFNKTEEQYFHTMKIPEIIFELFNEFVNTKAKDDGNETPKHFNLKVEVKNLETRLHERIETMIEDLYQTKPEHSEEITKFAQDQREKLNNLFTQGWTNCLLKDYSKKGWTFLFEEYAGVATRNVWFAVNDDNDLIQIVSIKLLGSQKDNIVVDMKRILLDYDLIKTLLETIYNGGKK